ncbi:MAG: hypothetical protein HOC78_02965 [Candidatus Komeilibacteria bacterium]|jgi:hypothetical protein|nr:hypothetical protein [Candidatus Komeilibacteria bacterium]
MFITAHTSAALWISTRITDPILAFILGIVSHFIFDMIPHGDESLADHVEGKRAKFLYEMRVAFIDTILAVVLIYFFVSHGPVVNPYVLYPAVLGTWLPDIAWIAIEHFKLTKFYWYIVYHGKLHNFFDWQYSIVYGVPFQIIVTLSVLKMSF